MNVQTAGPFEQVLAPTCEARVLAAWLPPDRVAQYVGNGAITVDLRVQSQIDQLAVARFNRNEFEFVDTIDDTPPELSDHIVALRAVPAFEPYAREGWSPRMVDLRSVVAAQPLVFTSTAGRRLTEVKNLIDLARFTLPLERGAQVNVTAIQPNDTSKAFKIVSNDPQLRADVASEGAIQFWAAPSYMQVARYRGRDILRDGYHRAYELLRAGIARVPVLYRDVSKVTEMFAPAVLPGLLTEGTWLDRRPPLLADYLDDTVALSVQAPRYGKALIVQITEMPWP